MDDLTPEEQALLDGAPSGFAAPSPQGPTDQVDDQLDAAELQLIQAMNEMQVDSLTGEEKPPQVWGVSPDQPANESVLDLSDRAKLSLGDPIGRVDYLKSKYEDATINSKGELTVKANGKWNYADPRGFEFTKNPWTLTKEVIADTALDQAGSLLIAAGAVGGGVAGTFATPGAGTAGGAVAGAAAGEALRSSLGRVVGTYQADAVQQNKDIAFESMMQLAGEKFVPGVKKSVGAIANGVEKLGIKNGVEAGASKLARYYSRFNVGEGPMRTITQYGSQVKDKMKAVARATGNDDKRYIEKLTSDSIQHVKSLAAKAPRILSKTYNKFQKQIVDSVDDGFKSNIRTTALEGYAKSIDDGVAKMVRAGKEITDPAEVMRIMQYAQKAGRLPKGTAVALKSQAELVKNLQRSGEFGGNALKIANDPEAYGLLKKLHSNLDIAFNTKVTSGKVAAKNMMAFKREMNDVLFNLSSKADDEGLNAMRKSFQGYSDIVELNTKKSLDSVGQGGLYTKMNSEWSKLNNELKPLSRAHVKSFRGETGDAPFEALLSKIKSNPGRNQLSKGSLESIEQSAKLLGDTESSAAIRSSRVGLDINEAAAAFNPYLTRPGTAAVGMGTYGVLTQNWPLVMAVGGVSGTIGSPTVTKNTVYATQSMWKGMGFLKSMTGEMIDTMAKDPVASSAFINTMVDSTAVQTQINNQLTSQLMPQAAAAEPVPQEMLEAQAASAQPGLDSNVAEVEDVEIKMEDVKANAVGTKLQPKQLGITAMAAASEGRIDPLSNNLRNLKKDTLGGVSLGLYHMSQGQKTLPKFIKASGLESEFEGYDPVRRPEEYAKRWAEVGQEMGEEKFAKLQQDYMENKSSNMIDAKKALRASGMKYDSLPDPLKALVFSTAVATGGGGAASAIKHMDPKASDADKAALLTLGRLNYWASRPKQYNRDGSVKFDPKDFIGGWTTRTIKEQKQVHKELTGRDMSSKELAAFERAIKAVTSKRKIYTNSVLRAIKNNLGK